MFSKLGVFLNMVTTVLQSLWCICTVSAIFKNYVQCLVGCKVFCDDKKLIQIYQRTTEVNGEKTELYNSKKRVDCST